jgi:hypothetical protein
MIFFQVRERNIYFCEEYGLLLRPFSAQYAQVINCAKFPRRTEEEKGTAIMTWYAAYNTLKGVTMG